MADMEIDKITERIIGSAHKVSNTLGSGFTENVYQNALVYQTRKDGLRVFQQHRLLVKYDSVVVGEFFLDMLVNDLVIVEIKAVSTLANEHMAQGFNYLRASGLPACLLINFGAAKSSASPSLSFSKLENAEDPGITQTIFVYLCSSGLNMTVLL